jgi:hypothetical protein
VSAVHPPVSAMKIHHPVQRKNAEIVSCYAKPSNKKSGTRIFPKTTHQKEMRDWPSHKSCAEHQSGEKSK